MDYQSRRQACRTVPPEPDRENLKFIKPDETTPCDVVFAALPTGQIMKMASALLDAGTKIIDLT
jgi:N-acetyl-gamma-glutamylphosphate reductase